MVLVLEFGILRKERNGKHSTSYVQSSVMIGDGLGSCRHAYSRDSWNEAQTTTDADSERLLVEKVIEVCD
jgi:hypothetical protein